MARINKYTDEQLLDVVIRYAQNHQGKIMAAGLARWARENIQGMEEVRDYHFMRCSIEPDSVTGKKVKKKKQCTAKIEELNGTRNIVATVNGNLLLKSSNIDAFFELPVTAQRKLVVTTRKQMDEMMALSSSIQLKNQMIKSENIQLKQLSKKLESEMEAVRKKQELLNQRINHVMQALDHETRKQMLSDFGVADDGFDLKKYRLCMEQAEKTSFDISKAIRKHEMNSDSADEFVQNLGEEILSGLNAE